jgi:hypothetical protein
MQWTTQPAVNRHEQIAKSVISAQQLQRPLKTTRHLKELLMHGSAKLRACVKQLLRAQSLTIKEVIELGAVF